LGRIVIAACSRLPLWRTWRFDDGIEERKSPYGEYVDREEPTSDSLVEGTLRLRQGLKPKGPGHRKWKKWY